MDNTNFIIYLCFQFQKCTIFSYIQSFNQELPANQFWNLETKIIIYDLKSGPLSKKCDKYFLVYWYRFLDKTTIFIGLLGNLPQLSNVYI